MEYMYTLLFALALSQTSIDKDVSTWAVENTPVYGSNQSANEWSDSFRTWSGVAMAISPGTPDERLERFMIAKSTRKVIKTMKEEFGRERPDGSNRLSMPSGHTATATIQGNLSSFEIFHDVVPALTGWARVEAGRHYPSDVIAGYSIAKMMLSFNRDNDTSFFLPNITDDEIGFYYFKKFD